MAVVDENAAALGVPQKQLMESSGHAIGRSVGSIADPDASVTIVAGRGNNGGDALIAGRFLDDYDLRILLLGRPETITTDIARKNWTALQRVEYNTEQIWDAIQFDLGDPDVIVDAMLDTGISGDLREPARTAAEAINDHEATFLSVDVPGWTPRRGRCQGPLSSPTRSSPSTIRSRDSTTSTPASPSPISAFPTRQRRSSNGAICTASTAIRPATRERMVKAS